MNASRTRILAAAAALVVATLAASPSDAHAQDDALAAPPCTWVDFQPLASSDVPLVNGRAVVLANYLGYVADELATEDFYVEVRDASTLYPSTWTWNAAAHALEIELVDFDASAVPADAMLRAEIASPNSLSLDPTFDCGDESASDTVGLTLMDAPPELLAPTVTLSLLDRVMDRLECCADGSACWVAGVEPMGLELSVVIDEGRESEELPPTYQTYEIVLSEDGEARAPIDVGAAFLGDPITYVEQAGTFDEACVTVRVRSLYDASASLVVDEVCTLAADAAVEAGPMIEAPAACQADTDPDGDPDVPNTPDEPGTSMPEMVDGAGGDDGGCTIASPLGTGTAPLGTGLALLALGFTALRRRRPIRD